MKLLGILKLAFTEQTNGQAEPEKWITSSFPTIDEPGNRVFTAYPEEKWQEKLDRAKDIAATINADKARRKPVDNAAAIEKARDVAKTINEHKREQTPTLER